MYGAPLLFVLNLALNVMSLSWMHTVVILGFIPWWIKVMCSLFLLNGKNMLSGTLIKKLKLFNLIGVVNIVLWKKNCKNCGITHRVSCPHTHQQNGVVEHKHCHIVEIVLALPYHAKFPLQFWDDAFQTTCYLFNRLPSSTLKNLSPFKKIYNQIPYFNFLHVFGCECWHNLRPYNSNKLQPHST